MIEKAFEWIKNHGKPEVIGVGENHYSDRTLYRVEQNTRAKSVETSTLTSLVNYTQSSIMDIQYYKEAKNQLIVHVISPTQVKLYTVLDDDRKREELMEVNAQIPAFSYDRFYDLEAFNIALQSKFIPNEDRELLLKFTGTAEAGTVGEYGDDGVSQKVTVKTGITSKTEAIVPNPVQLKPYSTFTEVEQPERLFVFRMKDNRNMGIEAAIFEADGGAWKAEAMRRIHQYLYDELRELIKDERVLLIQ